MTAGPHEVTCLVENRVPTAARTRLKRWHVDDERIAVVCVSARKHLAFNANTHKIRNERPHARTDTHAPARPHARSHRRSHTHTPKGTLAFLDIIVVKGVMTRSALFVKRIHVL